MKKEIKKLENAEVEVTLSFEGEEWATAQQKAFNKIASEVEIKGFRKGKAPLGLVKQRVSDAQVLNEAVDIMVQPNFVKVLEEEKIVPFMQPDFKAINKATKEELEVVIVVPLKPVVELGEYKGLNIAAKEAKVSAKEVDEEIAKLQTQNAELIVKDGAAELGDTVVIDFEGYVDGKKFDGGSATNHPLELGSNSFVPGFEDQLVGTKAGDKKDVNVTFPTQYVPELAGKAALFKVTVNDVKGKKVPELNDDFVAELNYEGVKTVADLKKKVKGDLAAKKADQAKSEQLNTIIDTIVKNSKIGIPGKVVQNEVDAMLNNFKTQIEQNGLTVEQYYQITGQKEEDNIESMRKQAVKNLEGFLVTQEVAAKEGLKVEEKDLDAEYKKIADQYSMDIEKVKEILAPQKNQFAQQLLNQKLNELLVSLNTPAKEETKAEGEAKPEKKPAAKKATEEK